MQSQIAGISGNSQAVETTDRSSGLLYQVATIAAALLLVVTIAIW